MSEMLYTAHAPGTSYRQTTSRGDNTLVISAHSGDVWVSNREFTVPGDWATTSSNIPAFRVAAGQVFTLRLDNEEPVFTAAPPESGCRFSWWLAAD